MRHAAITQGGVAIAVIALDCARALGRQCSDALRGGIHRKKIVGGRNHSRRSRKSERVKEKE